MAPSQPDTPKSRKASKGAVQIKSSNSRLQLVFTFAGRRHYLSTGFADNPVNRKAVEMKARQIELDIASGNFDPTLEKYKPQSALSTITPITPIAPPKPSLLELWDKFIEYKTPQCSENTMRYMYGVYTGYMKRLPTHELHEAGEIRDFVVKEIPLDSAKRFLTRLSACCNWAIEAGMIDANPFVGMAENIKIPKGEEEDYDIDPFSAEERDRILDAIASNTFCPKASAYKHSYYHPLMSFLFKTGCRPSEAVSLMWGHISPDLDKVIFHQRLINTSGGKKIKPGLKNGQKRRIFPCNQSLRDLLIAIKPASCQPTDFVFPSPEGKWIDTNNLRIRLWKPILEGLDIRYRKLYQTRHTFITLALEATGEHGERLDAKDVARLVGNSPEVIYKHYAGKKRELFVPEF